VALDSAILPLALYFEPEEIAAASISLASKIFKSSKPRFTSRHFHKKTKEINQNSLGHSSELSSKELTGKEIIIKYFGGVALAEVDLDQNYMISCRTEEDLKRAQPNWFKHLFDRDILSESTSGNEKVTDLQMLGFPHENYWISMHQVQLLC
jgi:hypothetical protein